MFGAGLADALDQKRVDAAMRIVSGNSREAAVDNEANSIDRDGRLGDIRCHDDFRLLVASNRLVLIARRQFAVPFLEAETRLLPALAPRLPLPVPVPTYVGRPTEAYP